MSSEQQKSSDKPAPPAESTTGANGGNLAIEDHAVPAATSGARAQSSNTAGSQGKAGNAAQSEKAPVTNTAASTNADAKQYSEKQQLAEAQDGASAPPLPPKKGEEPAPEVGEPPQADAPQTQTQGERMRSTGGRINRAFRTIVYSIHGAGDTFRGKFSAGIDTIFGHEEGVEKNQRIAQQGMEEIRSAKNR